MMLVKLMVEIPFLAGVQFSWWLNNGEEFPGRRVPSVCRANLNAQKCVDEILSEDVAKLALGSQR